MPANNYPDTIIAIRIVEPQRPTDFNPAEKK
jgi:hypothetical protein